MTRDATRRRARSRPTTLMDVKRVPASRAAGGSPALAATLRYASAQTGLVRGARVLLRTNQTSGFDCPGCAWPEAEHRDAVEFCENGAKAVLSEATTRRVDGKFFEQHTVAELAERSDAWLNDQGRLVEPMVLRAGASPLRTDRLGGRFLPHRARAPRAALARRGDLLHLGPHQQRGGLPLPALRPRLRHQQPAGLLEHVPRVERHGARGDDRRRQGHASRSRTSTHADAIFVVGQNPGTNHPRMLTTLETAAKSGGDDRERQSARRGGNDALRSTRRTLSRLLGEATPLARTAVPVRINGDVAFFQGVMKEMLEEEERAPGRVVDRAFIEEHTERLRRARCSACAGSWAGDRRSRAACRRADRARPRAIAIESRAIDRHAGPWA